MGTQTSSMLTEKQIEDFTNNGFIVIEDMFSPEEMKAVESEVSMIVDAYLKKEGVAGNFSLDEGLFVLEKINHDVVAAVYDTICKAPNFLRMQCKKRLHQTVSSLLQNNPNDPLYTFKHRIRIDPPSDERRTYDWHQEVFYSIPRSNFIQVWSPVIRDTTIKNGTIEIAKGSHRGGIPKQTWKVKDGYADQIIRKEIPDEYETFPVEMKLGDILLFSGKTWHKSGKNTSKEHRFSMIGMWHDVKNLDFVAPNIVFNYRKETPEEYYESYFQEKE